VTEELFKPRMNHVAMSVESDWLDDARRDEIVDFYGEVFDWTLADSGEASNPLVMMTQEWGDFVYIYPSTDGEYMRTPHLDHYGFRVATLAELDVTLDRAKKRAASDDRVSIIDKDVRKFPTSTLTSCYIGFLLPLMVELQHYDRHSPPS